MATVSRLSLWRIRFGRLVAAMFAGSLFSMWGRRFTRHLGRTVDCLRSILLGSRLIRWLTAEPNPEVIVIDLREPLTIRPFILGLDYLVDGLMNAAQYSRIAEGIRRTSRGPGRIAIGIALILVAVLSLILLL